MKNFETHLELIFEVLARAGSVKSLGFCVWRRIPHKEAVLEPGPQELVWRIYISLGYMPSAPPTLHVVATWGLSHCHPEPNI